jgi:SAM-dependent methyltransferase
MLTKPKRIGANAISRARYLLRMRIGKLIHSGGTHFCPACRTPVDRFRPFGNPIRQNGRCPVCNSLERHRLDCILLDRRAEMFEAPPGFILHVAPEEALAARFRAMRGLRYVSADLNMLRAMERMDITDIRYPDSTFSFIYCSHVLEHVPDDRRALAEFHRVLAPGGWAMLQVPVTAPTTYEDFGVTTPEGRKAHFGQHDHVRRCGPDYADRMREAGFSVEALRASDLVSGDECERMGFQPDRRMFICRKPPAGSAAPA